MAKTKADKKAESDAKAAQADQGKSKDKKKQEKLAAEAAAAAAEPKRVPRLKTFYEKEIVGQLVKEFNYKNMQQVPRLSKIVINMGLGEAVANPKILESAAAEMATIAGQKPVITRAKKSIANYKLRTGMPIGCMVTLRRERMWEFLDRLVNVALPRVRDFRGVSHKGFDGKGNFSAGIKEQIIFPEIDYDKIDKIKGLNISIVTTAPNDEEARALLAHLGMPFRKK
ncbi:MAG: 50S ribosomal protein L5 [Pseudomonadota bacterium]